MPTRRSPGQLPFVTVKLAQSLDGRIATRTGDSQWISGTPALRFAHRLRRNHDAILVGIGTILKDDPRLNVRLVNGRSPLRVIVDSRLRTPPSARALTTGAASTLIATAESADQRRASKLEALGAEILRLPANKNKIDLELLLRQLRRRGVKSVLVEGGAGIVTSLIRAELVDRLVVIVAPIIIGRGIEAVGDLGIGMLGDAIRVVEARTRRLAEDVIFDCRLKKS